MWWDWRMLGRELNITMTSEREKRWSEIRYVFCSTVRARIGREK